VGRKSGNAFRHQISSAIARSAGRLARRSGAAQIKRRKGAALFRPTFRQILNEISP
jgi:hypothetical protein